MRQQKPVTATGPQQPRTSLLRSLGPGLVTGAADDDPSGIATYSQIASLAQDFLRFRCSLAPRPTLSRK